MAKYYVWSAAAGAGTGADWTNAYTTLAGALGVATNADTILVAHDHAATQTTAKTLTFPTSPGLVVICVDRGTGALATTGQEAVGAGSVAITLNGCGYIYGIEFFGATNNSSSSLLNIQAATTTGSFYFEQCKFRSRTTNAAGHINIGNSGTTNGTFIEARSCEFGFGATGQSIMIRNAELRLVDPSLYTSGSTPTSLFQSSTQTHGDVEIEGGTLAGLSFTNLFTPNSNSRHTFKICRTKMPASYTAVNSTAATPQTADVFLFDCANGDVHTDFAYANCLGTLVSDTGIKTSTGSPDPGASWKIVTTSNASFGNPFISPWIDRYNSTLSAMSPRIEILRDGSTTAYTTAQVWGEFTAKVTNASVQSTLYNDRQPLADYAAGTTASNQDAGAGLSSWTGEGGSAWSGKVEVSLTPAEVGEIRGRVCVGSASTTVYVEPVVRI